MFRFKLGCFEFYHYITVELYVIKKQIDIKIISSYIYMYLFSIETKALPKLQQKLRHIIF